MAAASPPLLRLLPSAAPAAAPACSAPAHLLHRCCYSSLHPVAWPVPRLSSPPQPAPSDLLSADSPILPSSAIPPDRPAPPAPRHPPPPPAPAPCPLACSPECSAVAQSTPAQTHSSVLPGSSARLTAALRTGCGKATMPVPPRLLPATRTPAHGVLHICRSCLHPPAPHSFATPAPPPGCQLPGPA